MTIHSRPLSPAPIPKSSVPGILWPATPAPLGASMLAMQFQLEQSQWWPRERLAEHQLYQLRQILPHAAETVPFYRERLEGLGPGRLLALDWEEFFGLPVTTRAEVQAAGETLRSLRVPADHGQVTHGWTSGSTGTPIHFFGTGLDQFFWQAFTLRDHLWHHRDFSGKLAIIRNVPEDRIVSGWGPSTDLVFQTGPCAMLRIQTELAAQVCWLQEQNPDYLLSYATSLHALARFCLARAVSLPQLRQARSLGEVVTPELRQACRAAWSAPLADVYSAQELGYIALQCPDQEHYHIQSENAVVEVLDSRGRPCQPGETGRVVVTHLHNFAMPLIRYDIGDYAEVGEACPCGRGLPVLRRIMGRARNMLTLPSGEKHFPVVGGEMYTEIAPVEQFQIVQHSLQRIEARLVVRRPLIADEEARLREHILGKLGYPFELSFTYPLRIERSSSGKFEDFRSEISA